MNVNLGFWEKLPKPFLALAPMEGVTDTVFRQMIARYGRPDVRYTEFTNVHGICSEGYERVAERLVIGKNERPIVAQIWGTEPEKFFQGAEIVSRIGSDGSAEKFDGIDINLGCPVKEVLKIGGGAKMISREFRSQVKEIIAAVKEGGKLPVSVKTRIGYREIETEEWAGFLMEQGLAEITFHLRTMAEKSKVPAHWEEMTRVVNLRNQMKIATRIAGNGDVKSRAEAEEKAAETRADGIVIGRGVFENPAVFAKDSRILTRQERLSGMIRHAKMYEAQWRGIKPFVEMRKSIKMYVSGFTGAGKLRMKLMQANSASELEQAVKEIRETEDL